MAPIDRFVREPGVVLLLVAQENRLKVLAHVLAAFGIELDAKLQLAILDSSLGFRSRV
jgi:hypothetical protein